MTDVSFIQIIEEISIYYINSIHHLCKYSYNDNQINLVASQKCVSFKKWNNDEFIFNGQFLLKKDNQLERLFKENNTFVELILSIDTLLFKRIDEENEKVYFGVFSKENEKCELLRIENIKPIKRISDKCILSKYKDIPVVHFKLS
ncbi:hypothetical protein KRX57_08675 [Weeksellaceae bacterium TAE3-ERU29]|nr:hypothetical protein [Weeksellaceae bacterium TAE3-ERU29]